MGPPYIIKCGNDARDCGVTVTGFVAVSRVLIREGVPAFRARQGISQELNPIDARVLCSRCNFIVKSPSSWLREADRTVNVMNFLAVKGTRQT